jgi:hypothetical protein
LQPLTQKKKKKKNLSIATTYTFYYSLKCAFPNIPESNAIGVGVRDSLIKEKILDVKTIDTLKDAKYCLPFSYSSKRLCDKAG